MHWSPTTFPQKIAHTRFAIFPFDFSRMPETHTQQLLEKVSPHRVDKVLQRLLPTFPEQEAREALVLLHAQYAACVGEIRKAATNPGEFICNMFDSLKAKLVSDVNELRKRTDAATVTAAPLTQDASIQTDPLYDTYEASAADIIQALHRLPDEQVAKILLARKKHVQGQLVQGQKIKFTAPYFNRACVGEIVDVGVKYYKVNPLGLQRPWACGYYKISFTDPGIRALAHEEALVEFERTRNDVVFIDDVVFYAYRGESVRVGRVVTIDPQNDRITIRNMQSEFEKFQCVVPKSSVWKVDEHVVSPFASVDAWQPGRLAKERRSRSPLTITEILFGDRRMRTSSGETVHMLDLEPLSQAALREMVNNHQSKRLLPAPADTFLYLVDGMRKRPKTVA